MPWLPVTQPFAPGPLTRFLAGHVVPGLDRHDPATGQHTRLIPAAHGPAAVTIDLQARPGAVGVRWALADEADAEEVTAVLRRWLDLDADSGAIDAALGADPVLATLVRARPGLRVPGAVDGVETTVLAVLGQQVSLRAACTFAGRLVAAFGTSGPHGLRTFPTPRTLAAAGPEAIRTASGITGARARTVHAVAVAAVDGLRLDQTVDRDRARAELLALPGIGPWTADYVALRVLGDPDAFLGGDLVLRRTLGVTTTRAAELRSESWRPWRGYATLHLWTQAVFA